MHEMGIVLQIIEIAGASIPDDLKGTSVERVNIKIGKLSAVVPDSLTLCFEIAAKGTVFEGAVLNTTEIPLQLKCRACSHEWIVDEPAFYCEKCNNGGIDIISGRELDIESIEIAD